MLVENEQARSGAKIQSAEIFASIFSESQPLKAQLDIRTSFC
jgi:hypothetical protein